MTPNTETVRRLVLERVRGGQLDPAVAARLLARAGGGADPAGGMELVGYTPVWEPAAPRPAAYPAVTAGDVLLVVDGADTHLPAGVRAVRLGIDLDGDTESWTAYLRKETARGRRPRGLVFDLPAGTTRCGRAVELVLPALRALISDRAEGPMPVVFLTGRSRPEAGAALGALAQVASAEDRRLRAVCVQVDDVPAWAEDAFQVALGELSAARPGLAQVRYGADGREIRVLRPLPARPDRPSAFRDGGRYLITGGARGIGLRLAALLAREHHARLVLTGRSEPDADQLAEFRRLEAAGAQVVHVRGDVTRHRDAQAAVDAAQREYGGLDGVLHSAGLNEDSYLVNKDTASAHRVLSVKLDGADHLDRLTSNLPLDFFVLFSSTSAYFGAPGQADYAAANRALGELAAARARRVAAGSRHGASVAVAWPLWAEGGMAISADNRRVLEEMQGMLPMPTEVGLRALSDAVVGGEPETLVVYGRADRIGAWVAKVSAEEATGDAGPEAAAATAVSSEDLVTAAEAYLLDLVTETARLPSGRLRADQEFSTFGVDSILIKKLTATLEDRFGDLPVTLLFEYRTVAELARFLADRRPDALRSALGPDTPRAAGPAGSPAVTGPASVDRKQPAQAAPGELGGGLPYDQAVAIVGVGGRYPGGADLTEFWQSLAAGTDLIREVPRDRWDNDRHLAARRGTPGAITGKWGGFLDDVARFDPLFFAISPGEAAKLDPNERIFLEVAWAGLEHAGYSRRRLHETTRVGDTHSVGVFVGVTGSQYGLVGAEQWGRGNKVFAHSMDYSIANRLSYVLDVHGPSMVLDTACSGSLTALHLACRSLLSGETRMAIAGGVNVNIHPIKYATLTDMRLLASDGRCRAFGEGGDGFVPGEGAGALILKRLSDALADGDRVHAVVRGTAVNHGGRSNGYTVPTPRAQGAVVADALRAARVDARTIGYVEAHGTGTALGDPVEVEGLKRAFAEYTDDTGFCAIGSVKSNIGHLEAAAGVCGITKVVLQFAHRTLVPTLHSEPVNPRLNLETTPFRPQRTTAPWPAPEGAPRRAAVSSFGAGGANGHVVLEEWPAPQGSGDDGRPYAVGLSARTPEQLRQRVEHLVDDLARDPDRALRDIAFTLLTGREEWDHRLAVVASSVGELLARLRGHLDGEVSPAVRTGRADGGEAPADVRPSSMEGRWGELADAWVAGALVDWRAAFADGPRPTPVPLPSYPFGGKRYWVDLVEEAADTPDTGLAVIRRTDAVIADHTVLGRPVVAGVVQLGLARQAAGLTDGAVVFQDVRWRVPLEVEDDTLDVAVRFTGDGTSFEMCGTGTGTVHSSGRLAAGDGAALGRLDVAAVRARCTRRVDATEVYDRAQAAGLRYGPLFRGLVALHRGDREALAELSRPGSDAPAWATEAAMTDSALHAVQGVLPEDDGRTALPASASRITFGASPLQARYAHVTLVAQDAERGTARADIALATADGTVLARFEGLRIARPAARSAAPAREGTTAEDSVPLYRPVWRPSAAGRPAPAGGSGPVLVLGTARDHGLGSALTARHRAAGHPVRHVLLEDVALSAESFGRVLDEAGDPGTIWFLGGVEERLYSADDLGQLTEALDRGPVALFHLLKALDAQRARTGVRVHVVTSGVQATDEALPARNPFSGGLPGLVAAASRELGFLSLSCVDVAREDLLRCARLNDWAALTGQLTAEPAARPAHPVALCGGVRYSQELERVDVSGGEDVLPLREGGRYLVAGGAGGLGTVVAEHLAAAYGARVLLTGRRPQEELPERARALLTAVPDQVAYTAADVTDEAALRRAVTWMRETWGGVDGVVHSAFVLNDRTLSRMDEETLRSSFGPKAYGTVVLQRVLAGEPLDFFAVFSSAISHNGNAGQANYAAASTLQDAYGRFLAARLHRPVRILNWGLWGESGSVATDDYRARVTARLGVEPISDSAGLDAFRRVLAGPAVQVAPVRLAGSGDEPAGRPPAVSSASPASPASPEAVRVAETAARRRTADDARLTGADFFASLEPYARVLLRDAFLGHGAWPEPGTTVARDELVRRLAVVPVQERLLDAALYALTRGGHLTANPDGTLTVPATEPEVPDPAAAAALRDRLVSAYPHATALADLLRECTEVLPEVLCGRRSGLSVLFPGGSDHKLAPLYHDDPRSEHFNAVCAAAVAGYAEHRFGEGDERLRLLEIGAGTGGTSRPVLDALQPFGDRFDYAFTDLSPGLVRKARERFSEPYPQARFSVLDIARDPASQGFEEGGYDVVLAANVLHATPDVRHNVRAAARLLRPGGLLVVNEGTRVLDAVTMIFGLTEGWWAYDDGELRQPHSPLLTPGAWRSVLLDSGLRGVRTVGAAGPDDTAAGQHVLLAERDAWPVPEQRAPEPAGTATDEPAPSQRVAAPPVPEAPVPDLAQAATAYLRRVFADVLKVDEAELDPAAPLSSYGTDSLVGMEVADRIEADLGTAPRHVPFESTSLDGVAAALLEAAAEPFARFTGAGATEPAAEPPASGAELAEVATAYLRRIFADVLGLDETELDAAAPLSSYGTDSLVSMEVVDRIEADLGPVPRTIPYESTSLSGVVEALLDDPAQPLVRLVDTSTPTVPTRRRRRPVPAGARPEPAGSDASEEAAAAAPAPGTVATPVAARAPAATAAPVTTRAPAATHAPRTVTSSATAHAPVADLAEAQAKPPSAVEDPLAIVGVSGRFPGGDTLDGLWDHLRAGRRAVTEVPGDRWDPAGADGTGRWGAFLDDVEAFDPLVFRMSPRDAERSDPQERLFLEAVWTALEDAGTTRAGLERSARATAGTGVGVFAGLMHSPYQVLAAELRGAGSDAHAHSAHWSVANRTSHVFGFTGPSLAVDTACSSALTALHLAGEAVRRGDCGAAVVGGVNLILDPSHHTALAGMKMLSPDGRSRSFDQDADGMVPGEGVGAVVLKPLSAALRDGDRVHGLVLGTAVNANGATDSMVTPSADAQEELLRRALARAGVRPDGVQYIEAQATGSPLADPVEAAALARVFGGRGTAVGSVKPSLGHLEAASGMAQLVKVLLQMRHGELAATLDCPRPVEEFDGRTLRLVREREPWPGRVPPAERVAAISSFGAGGANAHVVVAGPPTPARTPAPQDGPRLVLLSARREEQLRTHVERLRDHLAALGTAAPALADVARTLAAGREPLGRRLAVVARDVPELLTLLGGHLAGERPERVSTGHAPADADTEYAVPADVDAGAGTTTLVAAGAAWATGARLTGADGALGHTDGRIVSLPGYPFARTVHRLPAEPAPATAARTPDADRAETPHRTPAPAAFTSRASQSRQPSDLEENDVSETNGHLASEAVERIRTTVVDAVAAVLGVRPEDIGLDEHLSDFGFDSVTVIDLADRVNAELGTALNPADLYGFRNVGALVQALARQTAGAAAPAPARDEPAAARQEPAPPTAVREEVPGGHADEPVAVVGMAGSFPGSPDLPAYWAHLLAGRDLVGEIPAERFDWHDIYGDPSTDPEKVPSRWGGFLADADLFDPGFFRISPREAKLMDPQHRLFLETVWRTVEDAGHDPASLAGTDTGVFVGCGSTEYATLLLQSGVEIDGQLATGNAHSVLANRVSFLLDLRGPSEPVDTACSSSLVAVHRAVRAIQDGECSAAIAGGVNLTLTPTGYLAFGKSGMLAADGRCKTFDHRADGYVRGEGVGAVLLKPLSAALHDGDTVYALVRGTAVNHGGRAASLTAPNSGSQAAVITAAHRRGGTDALLVGYVEAHGTGTALGDPVELNGLTQAFRELGVGPDRGQFIGLGSVKTNVGHLETAAGIAGLIKIVLAMRHRMLPPTLHVERPNPLLDLAGSPFHLVDSARPWDRPRTASGAEAPRLAGVSSFGFGGVNAHVVVEEFVDPRPADVHDGTPELFVLSARTDDRLKEYAALLADHVARAAARGGDAVDLRALARTLQLGRPTLERRLAVVTDSAARLADALRAFATGEKNDLAVETTPAAPDRTAAGLLDDDDRARVLELARSGDLGKAAALWVRGTDIDWSALHAGAPWRRVAGLPTYPFARERHWLPPVPTLAPAAPAPAAAPANPAPSPTAPPAPLPAAVPAAPATPTPAAAGPVSPTAPPLPVASPVGGAAPSANGTAPTTAVTGPGPKAPSVPVQPTAATAADSTGASAAGPASGSSEELAAQVRVLLAEGIGLPPESVDAGRDLAAYGVDSISALRIMQRIQAAFGDHIPMAAIFECTTLNSLVQHLIDEYGVSPHGTAAGDTEAAAPHTSEAPAEPVAAAPEAAVVPFGDDGPGTPLYGLPGATGELTWLLHLRAWLGAEGTVRGVEFTSPAPHGTNNGHGLTELAETCAGAILADRPVGPYRLAGHSIAARLAAETARILTDAGHEVAQLILLDAPGPDATLAEDAAADVRAVAEQFAAVWSGSPLTTTGTGPDRESALRWAAESLSLLPGIPLRGTELAERLAFAADWRGVLRRAAGDTAVRPLALAGRTAVLATPDARSWDRALVPPPALLEPVTVPGGAVSREGAALLAARTAEPTPAARTPLRITDREVRTVPAEDRHFLVPINRSGGKTPSFWVHHLFGDVSYCIYLSRYLGMEHPLYGLEQLDSDLRFTEFPSIEAMAARYVAEIREEHPEGPYVLGGASFGGILAFEMARQLVEAGQEVSRLYLVDALLPGTGAWNGVDNTVITEENQDAVTLMLIGNSASQLWKADPTLTIDELIGMSSDEAIDHVTRHVVEGSPAQLSADEVHRLVRTRFALLDLNGKLLLDYEARPFARPVRTTVFHATKGFSAAENPYGMPAIGRDDSDTTNGLGSLAGDDVSVHDLDADHFTIVLEDNLRAIAEVVTRTLPALAPNGPRS
ncbi:SDR family NAD(P)-dependent oxidoreductase [Streptomyces sp. BB1-1-1]|uniref:SDR family NAD(P)-dependent oxidoreductase n=1 Tax=Streptomyces sp. BB1-1-1 TaxID=3074430 RepID=UPI00287799CF|nr:SDR family NAD(P)-dependent oxidoreductase [Streptomyces sp. BB1-1-1]WND33027.1 SDR family NAD(P)-dependent oxidoreductase [Streptomyces sp. BB1-1-1]